MSRSPNRRQQSVPEDVLLDYVEQRTGMRFSGVQHARLLRLLTRACQQVGLTGSAYRDVLHEDPARFAALLDQLTVRETYFFRERAQLELLRTAVVATGGPPRARPLRVWSAGCASGEEAYTLAMLLGGHTHRRLEVLGTDISTGALEQAAAARYGERALRAVSDTERKRYFRPSRGRSVVRDVFREPVGFQPGNLLEAPPGKDRFDAVLCRNVLIYLTGDAVAEVSRSLRDALAPGGWLVTGAADPPLDVEGLERVATGSGLMYRRAAASTAGAAPPVHGLGRAGHDGRYGRSRRTVPAGGVPAPVARRPPDQPQPPPSPESAIDAAGRAVAASPLDARQRYLLALVHLEQGDVHAAAEAAGAAVFLEPSFIVAHLLLGRIHEALGRHAGAHRSFRAAAALLQQLPDGAEVPEGAGETVQSLADVTASALHAHGRGRTA